ncbi:MAG: hypothetical protein ACO1SV_06690 [Fimbriimonas sp.]
MTRATNLVLGIAMGAIGVLLLQRLREVVREEDPEALADRLAQQLQLLEERTQRSPVG